MCYTITTYNETTLKSVYKLLFCKYNGIVKIKGAFRLFSYPYINLTNSAGRESYLHLSPQNSNL